MIEGLVSVIIPVFNRSDKLKEAVMSALLQIYCDIEIIIVDDGSTDETGVVASCLSKKWPRSIFVYSQSNSGPGSARELGRLKSRGEFIQYLDSDDILLPQKFTSQVNALIQNPSCGVAYSISYEQDFSFDPPLMRGPIRATGIPINYLFPKLLIERWWTTSCPLYHRRILDEIGPWTNLLNEEDWEYDGRIGALNTLLIWVPSEASIRRLNISQDHLSYGGCTDPRKIVDRVKSKHLLYDYAMKIGLKHRQPEMFLFSRECFFLSRQCAELGLEKESEMMFNLSSKASDIINRNRFDFLIYRLFGHLMGWVWIGRLTTKARNMLK
jgi:glycosyltransferase involved in cell wall biosynthesis